ncbi:MAG TPA: hypothetical protein VGM33_20795, partial [Baekduia sp.]
NRVGPEVVSRDVSFYEGLVLVPMVVVIIGLALYPQLALHKSEPAVTQSVRAAEISSGNVFDAAAHPKLTVIK